MRVVMLGAGGGVSWAVNAAVTRGWDVVAAARSRPSVPAEVEEVAVDVRDAAAVHGVLRGAKAVLWCVGVTTRSGPDVGRTSLARVVAAAQEHGVGRLVSVSGAGVTLPGDVKGVGPAHVRPDAAPGPRPDAGQGRGTRHLECHRLVVDGGPAATARRPGGDPPLGSGGARARVDGQAVARADVALAMLDLAGSQPWVRRSPFRRGRLRWPG